MKKIILINVAVLFFVLILVFLNRDSIGGYLLESKADALEQQRLEIEKKVLNAEREKMLE